MLCNCRTNKPELYPSEARIVDDLLVYVDGQIPYECHRCGGYFRINEVTRDILPLSEDDLSRLADYRSWCKERQAARELKETAYNLQFDKLKI